MAKYAEILFRQRLKFVALLLIPIALGVTIAVVFANYRAAASLRIEDPAAFGTSFVPVGWSPNQSPAQNLADSVSQVVKSGAFAPSLADRLTSSGAVSSSAVQQTVASAVANLKATPSGSHVVTLTYSCPHPAVCVSVLSATIDIFHEQLVKVQQDQASAANTFWSAQLADAQGNLAAAQTALQTYAAANPTVAVDASSSDPHVVQLVGNVQLWRTKVAEAQNSLSQAQYVGTASARFMQIGTSVVDAPHLASSRYIGDGGSLIPGVLVLLLGLVAVGVYVFLLGWADRTASDPRALERRLGVAVVATIPRLAGSSGV
ncbi:MAG TPA: hypothetical protein VLR46_15100 [Candidatus Dormibacteraeota bacterium]|nr:hypothetical protein [Candidatus Dormibacteraeota bacterium]